MFSGSLPKCSSILVTIAIIIVLASAGFCAAGSYSFNASPKPNYTFFSFYKSAYSFNIGPRISFVDSYGVTWSSPIKITNSLINKDRPSIVQTPSFGPLQVITNWVFWQSKDTNDLYYILSHDSKGLSWTSDQAIVTNGDNYRPASTVVRCGSYSLWIIWGSKIGSSDYDIYSKSFSENQPFDWQWSNDKRMDDLSTAGYYDAEPSIIRDSNGSIWIAWSSIDPINPASNLDICLANSTDNGMSWHRVSKRLSGIGSSKETYPSLAEINLNGMKKILIAYQSDKYLDYQNGDNEIYCSIYDPGNGSFDPLSQVTNNNEEDVHPTILRKQNEEIWIAWEKKPNTNSDGEIYYAISPYNAQLWDQAVDISNSPARDDRYPSMTQTWDGKVWIVWSSNRDANNYYQIYGIYGEK